MEDNHPNLRLIEQSPWNRGEAYEPEAIQRIRNRLNRSAIEKIGDALESPFALGVYVGIYIGCMITVGMAFVWSVL